MSVPTIASISPTTGPTMGDFVIGITGTNFRVPPLPGPGASTGLPSVQVLIDGVASDMVSVFDTTFLTALLPNHPVGAVSVEVINLDDAGAPIPGEHVTLPNAFTFVMPIFTAEADSDLARVIRTLLREVKKQFMQAEVTYAVSTDYDPDTGDELHVTKFAKLPGISLIGPDLRENRFYSLNAQVDVDDPNDATAFVETRVPYTVDLLFSFIVASNNKFELLNMMAAFVIFMHRNKFLYLDVATNDPSKQVRYEMDFQADGHPKTTLNGSNESNIRSFEVKIEVRGFDIETLQGISAGTTAGVPNQAIVSRGKTLDQLTLDPSVQLDVHSGPGPSPGP